MARGAGAFAAAACAVPAVAGAVWAQTAYKPVTQELSREPVEQPLPFSHKAHVALGVKCRDCHAATKTESLHIRKLAEFDKAGEPVPWVKIYRVPDFVWFSHASHVEDAAIACASCHGPG